MWKHTFTSIFKVFCLLNAIFLILIFWKNGTIWFPFNNSGFVYKLFYIRKDLKIKKLSNSQIKLNIPAQE